MKVFANNLNVPDDDMKMRELECRVEEAGKIARELHHLLHEDALHRLRLYQEYSRDPDNNKWTPDLYLRCQLVERLCKKLADQT